MAKFRRVKMTVFRQSGLMRNYRDMSLKNKQIFIVAGAVILVIVLAGIWLVNRRPTSHKLTNSKTEEDQAQINQKNNQKETEKILTADIDQDLKEIAKQAVVKPPFSGQNSREKIIAAREQGKISFERALVLKIIARFAPDKLPAEFKSDKNSPPLGSWQTDVIEMTTHWNEFSEETRKFLEPFMLPPDNEKSFFNPNNNPADFFKNTPIFSLARPTQAQQVFALVSEKITAPGEPGDSWLFYFIPASASQAEQDKVVQQADNIKAAWQKAWPRYKAYLGSWPATGTKVYLTANINPNFYGVTYPYVFTNTGRMSHCRIDINSRITNHKVLQATVVHELFHCFQFFYSPEFLQTTNDRTWLLESTAVWSENFIYPDYNSEHEYLPLFFSYLNWPRLSTADEYEYASYMLFFFLDQYLGNQKTVANVFNKFKNVHQVKSALKTGIANFDQVYGQFAVYNWNRVKGKIYKDNPLFPDIFPKTVYSQLNFMVQKPGRESFSFFYDPGGIFYSYFVFPKKTDEVKYIRIQFKTEPSQSLAKEALLKIGDDWRDRDWTMKKEAEICRDWPGQEVKALVLAVANTDLNKKQTLNLTMTVSDKCPAKPQGYIKVKEKIVGGPLLNSTYSFAAEQKLKYNPEASNEGEESYEVIEQSLSCETHSQGNLSISFAGVLPVDANSTENCSGHLTETYAPGERPWQIIINKDEGKATIRLQAPTKNNKWVHCVTTKSVFGSSDTYAEDRLCGGWDVPTDFEVDYDGSGILKGEINLSPNPAGIFPVANKGNIDIKAEYFYVLGKE